MAHYFGEDTLGDLVIGVLVDHSFQDLCCPQHLLVNLFLLKCQLKKVKKYRYDFSNCHLFISALFRSLKQPLSHRLHLCIQV